MQARKKLSTTIGADNFTYLHALVRAGKASSVGQAVDLAIERARRLDNRARLSRDTAAYFANLPAKAAQEEAALEAAMSSAAGEVDFDQP